MNGYVPSGDTQIYFESHGDGPAVIFLHAGVADSRMWQDQMGRDGYRSVCFDQRGFGKTNWIPGPYADWRDVVAVMDHLEIESAVVVGCSLGGGIAMHTALAAPDRVNGLVLVGAAAKGWEPADGWPELAEWDEAVAAYDAGNLERVLELDATIWLAGNGRTLEEIDSSLLDLFIDMDRTPMGTESERSDHVEAFEPQVNDRLDDIEAPTLVLVGAYDQPDLIESADYLASRLSDRPRVLIEGAAHLPSLEQPDSFNQALDEFLSSL